MKQLMSKPLSTKRKKQNLEGSVLLCNEKAFGSLLGTERLVLFREKNLANWS